MVTISLCMIVKNEEGSLERCLNSVKGIADEIIIVDTGSTDRTKEIALRFRARIYNFEWIDHFGAARNFAFSKATKDYILWLDADDTIEKKDRLLFQQLKKTLPRHIDSVTMPYNLAFDSAGKVTSSLRRNRLVRRACNFQWIGPVHEYLAVGGQIMNSEVCITHKKDKVYTDRNLRIYRTREAAGEDFSPRDLYYFANELRDNRHLEEAVNYYQKFLQTGQGWIEDNIQACVKMADCYAKLGKEEQQFHSLFRSFTYDKPRAEVACTLGGIFMEKKQYTLAIYWYEQATKLPSPPEQMSMVNASDWTWLPNLQLCLCYDRMGQHEKACYYNEIAMQFNPIHPSMIYNQKYFKALLGDKYQSVRPE